MSWLKKKYEETKKDIQEDWEERKKSNKETRAAARKEYYKVRQEQQIELARKKAIFQREKRERQLKAKYAPRPARTYVPIPARTFGTGLSSGFGMTAPAKTSSPGFTSWQPSGIMQSSYFAPAKPKTIPKPKVMKTRKRKSKRKGKKKAVKYIIRGGVAYPIG